MMTVRQMAFLYRPTLHARSGHLRGHFSMRYK